jgi:hypothetical protein
MTILISVMALAASPATVAIQPTAAPAHATHATHAQSPAQAQPTPQGTKKPGEGCACCQNMASGGKMACCEKGSGGHTGEHSGH